MSETNFEYLGDIPSEEIFSQKPSQVQKGRIGVVLRDGRKFTVLPGERPEAKGKNGKGDKDKEKD